MIVVLDTPRFVRDTKIAALVECAVSSHFTSSSVTLMGHKQPLAILLHRDGTTIATAPDGRSLSRQDVDVLCPGAWRAFLNWPDASSQT